MTPCALAEVNASEISAAKNEDDGAIVSANQLFSDKQPKAAASLPLADSKVIGKKKLWRTTQVLNEKTGRLNQRRQCKVCLKTFGKMSNVKDHVRTHNLLKPFACSYCPQTFSQQGNRDRHMKRRVCQVAHQ